MTIQLPELKRQRFDSEEQELFLNLWRTYDLLRGFEDALFCQYDLTAQQYNALRLLRAARPRKIATLDLARRLVSRAPDITRMLDKLHDRGLISRERPADDRRTVHVGLTDKGESLLADLDDKVRECHRSQVGHLTTEERDDLTRLLRRAREPHELPGSGWA